MRLPELSLILKLLTTLKLDLLKLKGDVKFYVLENGVKTVIGIVEMKSPSPLSFPSSSFFFRHNPNFFSQH
ncbi:unnamed protein product [Lactuca virosa]|uniref:Uncharacterized protein n=1 Tax=Lactuca virosa TaxID=75947 RepID=A0AAU9M3F0_9ASTR|nr:unnamed protein product [Lactuca virosa]